jgi:hypothetical protein
MPDLVRDYDAIGFSIDSCFVKYNEPEITKLIVKTLLSSFHEDCKYPKEILQFDERNLKFCLNNSIWDI